MADTSKYTDALAEPYRDYWLALGRFIDLFAQTENQMKELLRFLAGTDRHVSRVIFSGLKIEASIDTCKRLMDATDRSRMKVRLEPVFKQLSEINTTRNNIVHWGTQSNRDSADAPMEFRVSNSHLVQKGRTVQNYLVSPGDFDAMSGDLHKITMRLSTEMFKHLIDRQTYRRVGRPVLGAAWQYKPPQRGFPDQKNLKASQSHPRQPSASPMSPRNRAKKKPKRGG